MSEGLAISYTRKRPRENVLVPPFRTQRYNCTTVSIYPREAGKITKDLAFEHLADVACDDDGSFVGSGDGRVGATISDSIVVIGDE